MLREAKLPELAKVVMGEAERGIMLDGERNEGLLDETKSGLYVPDRSRPGSCLQEEMLVVEGGAVLVLVV